MGFSSTASGNTISLISSRRSWKSPERLRTESNAFKSWTDSRNPALPQGARVMPTQVSRRKRRGAQGTF